MGHERGKVVEEKRVVDLRFYKCPFCSWIFCSRADLDKHMATFWNAEEQHAEAYRRTHGRAEYGSAEQMAILV